MLLPAGLSAWLLRKQLMPAAVDTAVARAVKARVEEISSTVAATGTVRLRSGAEVKVGAQVSGIVRHLYVTIGSRVKQGEVIAEIDSSAIVAKVNQAQAQLGQSQVSLAKAQNDQHRAAALFQSGLIPRQQLEDADAALHAAEAAYRAAERNVDAANVDLAYVQIRAPISGTVATVSTQKGETVAASFASPTFVTIIRESALEVVAMVDEADIGSVRVGQKAVFTAETYPDHEFTGRVTRIAPAATIVSGVVNYEVAISIDNDVVMLRPDMTSNVTISTARRTSLLLPQSAIHRDDSKTSVLLRSPDGREELREVKLGQQKGDSVEVLSGVTADDSVVGAQEGSKP
jgi:RND family efflux transporter MFP subunit